MKLTIQTNALAEACSLIKPAIPSRTPKPILQGVLLDATDALRLVGTNLELGISTTVTAVEIAEKGKIVLPLAKLLAILDTCAASVVMESDDKFACTIESDGRSYTVFGYDPADYPSAWPQSSGQPFTITKQIVSDIVRIQSCAAKPNASLSTTAGVLVSGTGGKASIVATDGHAMGVACREAPCTGTVILHQSVIPIMVKLVRDDGQMSLGEHVVVTSPHGSVWSQSINGNFPKYKDVIPPEDGKSAHLCVAEFLDAVKAAAIFCDETSKQMTVSFGADVVTIAASDSVGSGSATIPCQSPEPWSFLVNPDVLLKVLVGCDSERVSLYQNGALKPIRVSDGPDSVFVFMPLSKE